jgi:pimeloyl-ACP methyl ester carboxylesterase
MSTRTSTGWLHDGIPYLKVGQGPPLLMVMGLTPEHDVPKGWQRRAMLSVSRPLTRHFAVYVVNRKRGLRPGESMSDIAGHLSNAIEHDMGEPVFLEGTSTGGSVVLQLAVDRPDLVRRLVVISSAFRLGPEGRALQAEMARRTRADGAADAFAHMMTTMLHVSGRPMQALARRAVSSMVPDDPTDLLVTLDAEDAFDVEAELPQITAPTLVIGGMKDQFYPPEYFERTAAGVRDGRVHLFDGWGHMRASSSSATANLLLGFMLGEAPARSVSLPDDRLVQSERPNA